MAAELLKGTARDPTLNSWTLNLERVFPMYPTNEQDALAALKGDDRELAATAEAILWRTWCRAGDSETERIFRAGVEAMQQHKLAEAETLFSRVIERAPDFAEGWNKRATVRYVMKQFAAAITDCQETLARNPNHFGAASGQGLCHMSIGEFREAAICFRRALEIHPYLDAVRHNLALAEAEGGRQRISQLRLGFRLFQPFKTFKSFRIPLFTGSSVQKDRPG